MGTGRPPGNYNPREKNGQFGKGRQYSDDVSIQQEQIAKQKATADSLNREDAERHYIKRATQAAKSVYKDVKKTLEEHKEKLNQFSLDDETKFIAEVKQFLKDNKIVPGDPACHRVAGAVGAILKQKGHSFICQGGACLMKNSNDDINKALSNHVWVDDTTNGKRYEYFVGRKDSELGEHKERFTIQLDSER